jgi:hypothetical protein
MDESTENKDKSEELPERQLTTDPRTGLPILTGSPPITKEKIKRDYPLIAVGMPLSYAALWALAGKIHLRWINILIKTTHRKNKWPKIFPRTAAGLQNLCVARLA